MLRDLTKVESIVSIHTSHINMTTLNRNRAITVSRQIKATASVSFLVIVRHHERDAVAQDTYTSLVLLGYILAL